MSTTTRKLGKGMKDILNLLEESPDEKFTKKDLENKTKKTKGTISDQVNTLITRELVNYTTQRPIKIWKLQTSNFKPQTSNLKPETQTSNLELETSDFKPETQTPNLELETSDFKPETETSNLILETSKHELPKPTTEELEIYLKTKTYIDHQTNDLIQKHPEYFISNSKLTQLGKFEILSFFPTLDEIQTHIETSLNNTAQIWQRQINKHNKFSTIEQIHSLILEKFLLKLKNVINE